jgi:uncharacterized membrane protein YdjX (TVP38/TMEM64 family)
MYPDGSQYQAEIANSSAAAKSIGEPDTPALVRILRQHWHKLLAVAFWLLLIGSYAWYMLRHNLTPLDVVQNLVGVLASPAGPLLYIFAFSVRPLIFFSAALLTMVAGSIFGPVWGVLLTMVASNTSASLVYLVGSFLGQGWLDKYTVHGNGVIQRYTGRLRRNSFKTVLTLNLLMLLPFDLISYTAGLLRVSYRPFLLGTVIGSIPGILGCVLLGASVQIEMQNGSFTVPTLHPWAFVLAILLFVATMVFSRYLQRHEEQTED